MVIDYAICVGTVGGGLSHSPDGGESWDQIREPIPSECNVRALAVYQITLTTSWLARMSESSTARTTVPPGRSWNHPWMVYKSGLSA